MMQFGVQKDWASHAVKELISQSQKRSQLILILIVLVVCVYNIAPYKFLTPIVSDLSIIVINNISHFRHITIYNISTSCLKFACFSNIACITIQYSKVC